MNDSYLYFENEETLIKELLQHLNAQYEYVDEKEDKNVYYDWIYWTLDKLSDIQNESNH